MKNAQFFCFKIETKIYDSMITGSLEHFNISYFARVKKCFSSFRSKNGIPALLVVVCWCSGGPVMEYLNLISILFPQTIFTTFQQVTQSRHTITATTNFRLNYLEKFTNREFLKDPRSHFISSSYTPSPGPVTLSYTLMDQ